MNAKDMHYVSRVDSQNSFHMYTAHCEPVLPQVLYTASTCSPGPRALELNYSLIENADQVAPWQAETWES